MVRDAALSPTPLQPTFASAEALASTHCGHSPVALANASNGHQLAGVAMPASMHALAAFNGGRGAPADYR